MKILKRLLLIGVLAYAGAALWLYLQQDSMIYHPDSPTREIVSTPASLGLQFEDLRLQTTDHEEVHAWYVPNQRSKTAILVCHGNAGNISHRLDTLQHFNALGLNVVLFDYRGFGQSSGVPSEQGSYLDAQAVWSYLHTQGYQPEQIVIFGRSLGGGVASELAMQKMPAAVILESTFTSIPDRGAELYPWLPVQLLARTSYNNLAKISGIRAPILFLHSEADEVIPYQHARRLYDKANKPKYFYQLTGDHNNGWRNQQGYDQAIAGFLRKHLSPRWF